MNNGHTHVLLIEDNPGDADLVLVEGAGSASEINLRLNDIANMGFARAANDAAADENIFFAMLVNSRRASRQRVVDGFESR